MHCFCIFRFFFYLFLSSDLLVISGLCYNNSVFSHWKSCRLENPRVVQRQLTCLKNFIFIHPIVSHYKKEVFTHLNPELRSLIQDRTRRMSDLSLYVVFINKSEINFIFLIYYYH